MKYKFFLATFLLGALLLSFSVAANAATTLTVTETAAAAGAPLAVAPGDSIVIGTFTVTNGGTADDISTFRVGLTAGQTMAGGDVKSIAIYQDINQNGLFEPSIDVRVISTATPGAFVTAAPLAMPVTAIAFAASAVKKYLVVVQVAKVGAAVGAYDNNNMKVDFSTVNAATTATNIVATTTSRTINVVANHFRWNKAVVNDLIATGAANTVFSGAGVVLTAIDDYGNTDLNNAEAITFSAKKYLDLTAVTNAPVDDATNWVSVTNTVAGVLTSTAVAALKINTTAAEVPGVVLSAAGGTTGLVGTITVGCGAASAYPTADGIAINRGIEYYDVDHNGKIDTATFFFNSIVRTGGAGANIPNNAGPTACPISAFSVTGYNITSGGTPLLNQDNGGFGIYNGGPFAVTIKIDEGSAYDTNALPQGTYNSLIGTLTVATGANAGTVAISSVGPGDATEMDRARPILLTKKTVDNGVATGTANDGYADGIELMFSEPVVVTANMAATAQGADPAAITTGWKFALGTVDRNGNAMPETLVGTSFVAGSTVTLAVANVGTKNTGFWPVLKYSQRDAAAANILKDSAGNELIVNQASNLDAVQSINIDDGIAAQVVTVATKDNTNNGKIDQVAVEFTEAMDNSTVYSGGVTFDSGISTYGVSGVYASTSAVIGTSKVINFTITESGTGVYDTDAKPTFKFDQSGKLCDAHFTKVALYGTGQVVPAIPSGNLIDGAAPKIVSATTGDVFAANTVATTDLITGAASKATDGRIDTFTIVFSEPITVKNKTGGYTDLQGILYGFQVQAGSTTLSSTSKLGANGAGQTNIYDNDTVGSPDFAYPELLNGGKTLVLHFDEATIGGAGGTWSALMVNGGDTGVKPNVLYTAGATNYVSDLANNTLENITAGTVTEVDGAAPRMVKALTSDFLGTLTTTSEDNADGDGFIDSFRIYFTEKMKIADATNIGGVKVWVDYGTTLSAVGATVGSNGGDGTNGNQSGENLITMNIGVDANNDTYTATAYPTAPAITALDNASNFDPAYFSDAWFYGTNAKTYPLIGDTGKTPVIYYDGTALMDTTGNLLATFARTSANVVSSIAFNNVTLAASMLDTAKPVIMRANGILGSNQINLAFSENIYKTTAGSATSMLPAAQLDNTLNFGYFNGSGGDVAALFSGTSYAQWLNGDASDMTKVKIFTTGNLTAADIAGDMVWIKAADLKDAAGNIAVNDLSSGIVQASPQKSIRVNINYSNAPYVTKIESVDIDNDGWIDNFKVTFSREILSTTFPGYVINTLVPETIITFPGYTNPKFNFYAAANATAIANGEPQFAWAANSATVWIKVDERSAGPNAASGIGDTGNKPAIVYAQTMPLTDLEQTPFNLPGSAQIVTDAVAPVIMTANQLSSTVIEVVMSEDIDGATVKPLGFNWGIAQTSIDGYDQLEIFATAAEVNPGKVQLTLPAAKALPAGVAQTIGWNQVVNNGVTGGAVVGAKDLAALSGIKVATHDGGNGALATLSVTLMGAAATPAVTVMFPNGGESFAVGSPVNVSWSAANVANVKIESSVDGGVTWATVAATVPAAPAVFAWTPAVAGANMLIKITDAAGTATDMSNAVFNVVAGAVVPPVSPIAKAVLNQVPSNVAQINNSNVTRVAFTGAATAGDSIKVKIVDVLGASVEVLAVANAAGNFVGTANASALANGMVTLKAGKQVNGAVATWYTFADYLKDASTIGAPSGLVIADVPADNGGFVYATFVVSANHPGLATSDFNVVKSYEFYKRNTTGADTLWTAWAQIPAFSLLDAGNKQTVLIPTVKNVVAQWKVVASTVASSSTASTVASGASLKVAELLDGVSKSADGYVSAASAIAVGGSVDDIAPSALTVFSADNNPGNGVKLTWTPNIDHGVVGSFTINEVTVPIYGVDKYEVYRAVKGTTTFTLVGFAGPGSASYIDATAAAGTTVYDYYIKLVDGNDAHVVKTADMLAMSAVGGADFTSSGTVGLDDLVLIGSAWGTKRGDANWVSLFDLNNDGVVNVGDLVALGSAWGTSSKSAKVTSTPTVSNPFELKAQVNENNSMYLVNINVKDAATLNGVAFSINYDTKAFEFVKESVTGLVGITLANENKPGVIDVASYFQNEKFNGTITLGFKSKGLNSDMNIQMVNPEISVNNVVSAVTGVAAMTLKALPTVYGLNQNFPNPFNPSTTIEYSIPKTSRVELAIYNMAGQKVTTLVNTTQAASFYRVVWNGRNDAGQTVASGLYFYKLSAGNYSKVVKMNLIK